MDGRMALVTPLLVVAVALLVAVVARDVRRREAGASFVAALPRGSLKKAALIIAVITFAWWW